MNNIEILIFERMVETLYYLQGFLIEQLKLTDEEDEERSDFVWWLIASVDELSHYLSENREGSRLARLMRHDLPTLRVMIGDLIDDAKKLKNW